MVVVAITYVRTSLAPVAATSKRPDDKRKRGARALQSYDLLEAGLLHSKVPTLLIAGEQDGIIPDKMTDLGNDWAHQGGNVECAIIPDSGHLPMLDNPVLFQQVACAFLKTA